MALTDTAIRNAKPMGKVKKLTDGGGLQLWIMATGSKLWRFSYRGEAGKQKLEALGRYPDLSLADARTERERLRRMLARGEDPQAERKASKAKVKTEAATFAALAQEYVRKREGDGLAEATLVRLRRMLKLTGPLDARPIAELKANEVLACLQVEEAKGHYENTAKLREAVSQIFRYAVVTGRAEHDPAAALGGALIAPKVQHHPGIIDPKRFGELLWAIRSYKGMPGTRHALELLALLAPRSKELREAPWSEFDLEGGVWSIPAGRMKARRPHKIPLPPQALALLRELRTFNDDELVFPGLGRGRDGKRRPLSENTLNLSLRRLDFPATEHVVHGFRVTFSSLANESNMWSTDVIEQALAHQDADEIRRTYARGTRWDERLRLMSWWADQCDSMRDGAGGKRK